MSGRFVRAACSAVFLFAPVVSVPAQESCTYERCALGISPRLTALDVVRGGVEQRVASLAFLWPKDVSAPFRLDESAMRLAVRASHHRTLAAVFTDVGLIAVATGLTRSARGAHDSGRSITTVGLALVASSVPIHFSADGDLARAVWMYNRRFAAGAAPITGER